MPAPDLPPDSPRYRLLIVVRRGETSLYARLFLQYSGSRTPTEILWDRRQTERRTHVPPVALARRRGERRRPVSGTWAMSGFVVATVRR